MKFLEFLVYQCSGGFVLFFFFYEGFKPQELLQDVVRNNWKWPSEVELCICALLQGHHGAQGAAEGTLGLADR